MISYTPAVVFGLLRGELVMMRSQQSNLNLVLIKIVETLMNEKCVVCTIHNSNVDRSLFEGLNQTNSKDLGYLGYIPYYLRVWNRHRAGNKHRAGKIWQKE